MSKLAKIATAAAVIIILVVAGWFYFINKPKNEDENVVIAEKIFDLPLQDYGGQPVKLIDLARSAKQGSVRAGFPFGDEKILIVSFWASWCPFSENELASLAAIQKEYADSIVVVAVNRAEPLVIAKEYSDKLSALGLSFYLDPSDSYYKVVEGYAMPETVFIDRDQKIIEHIRGPIKDEELRAKVRQILETEN